MGPKARNDYMCMDVIDDFFTDLYCLAAANSTSGTPRPQFHDN